ncbi:hypothetical protein ACFL35_21335 [Candidatus Riflebacteria bacterium]
MDCPLNLLAKKKAAIKKEYAIKKKKLQPLLKQIKNLQLPSMVKFSIELKSS